MGPDGPPHLTPPLHRTKSEASIRVFDVAERGEYFSGTQAPHDEIDQHALARINPQGIRQRVRSCLDTRGFSRLTVAYFHVAELCKLSTVRS